MRDSYEFHLKSKDLNVSLIANIIQNNVNKILIEKSVNKILIENILREIIFYPCIVLFHTIK